MEKLFEPIAINSMELPHRIITGPMERGLANRDGSMTTRYIDYLSARAAGGAGLIQIESTYVDVRGRGHLFQVGCHDDSVVTLLRQATSAVHALGGKLGLELYLGGRQTPSPMSHRQPIAASNVPCEVLVPTPIPREMTYFDMEDVVARFVAAAERAVGAGIDMIHIHGAHGYLIGSFVSPYSNRRKDRYGGSLANRARFPLELVTALRQAVGPDFPLGYRLSADEFIPNGLRIEESKEFASMLVDAGVDLIDVSGGIYESAQMIIQGVGSPVAPFLHLAKAIKDEVGARAAVSVAQRLSEPEVARRVIDEGIDMVSLSRAFHADPEFVNKLRSGNQKAIIPCVACHHCTDMLEANLPADCSVNPLTTRERFGGLERTTKNRQRVAVVGAGPGGIQAALGLVEAGHSVVLVERNDRIGGQLLCASRVGDFDRFLAYAEERLRDSSIEMLLATEADMSFLYEINADTILVASGARGAPRSYDVVGDVETHDLFSAPLAVPEKWS
ncbi:MAG: FAD-dependent oxidoreductase, partial [Acidimicrobiia bacterium]